MFDRTLFQVIENLIADEMMLVDVPDNFQSLVEVCFIKVAHAPGKDLAVAMELIECGKGVRQRIRTAPMQKIAIKPVGPESSERSFTCSDRFSARGIVGQDF